MSEVWDYVTYLLGKYKNSLNVYVMFSMKTKWLVVVTSIKLPMKQKMFIIEIFFSKTTLRKYDTDT